MGMRVVGMRRTRPDQLDERVAAVFTPAELPTLLAQADYVCNILPSTPATRGLLTVDILRACKPSCVLINVGRGDIISEQVFVLRLEGNEERKRLAESHKITEIIIGRTSRGAAEQVETEKEKMKGFF